MRGKDGKLTGNWARSSTGYSAFAPQSVPSKEHLFADIFLNRMYWRLRRKRIGHHLRAQRIGGVEPFAGAFEYFTQCQATTSQLKQFLNHYQISDRYKEANRHNPYWMGTENR